MPSQAEIRQALEGAWLLAKGDASGMGRFDLSVDGFWRSFSAILIVAPAYALLLLEQYGRLGWPEQTVATVMAELIAYVAGWLTFPVAAIFLTRLLGLSSRYVPLIVASNWTAVLQITLYMGVVILGLPMPEQLRTLFLLAATIAVLVYQWFVVRTALETSSGTAFGLVVIDILLSLAVSRAIDALLQPG